MSSPDNLAQQIYSTKSLPRIPCSSIIDLVNLLLRNTSNRVTVLEYCDGPDPEIYVVTRVEWRDPSPEKAFLPQLPKILSLLETLRGTKGVPKEVYLDSMEGIVVFLPSGMKVSQLPSDSKQAVHLLMSIVENSLQHMYSTMKEVELWFWRAARQRGFSPEILEKMERRESHFDSNELMFRFQRLLRKYFSTRFTIHRSVSCLRIEE